MVVTYGVPPELRGGIHAFILNHHTPSGQSRVYWVTYLRTDSIHWRESAGSGPVKFIYASLSYTHYWYYVDLLKVPDRVY